MKRKFKIVSEFVEIKPEEILPEGQLYHLMFNYYILRKGSRVIFLKKVETLKEER